MLNKLLNVLENKNIAIVGFGKEGISTYNFIRRYFKDKKLTIIDGNKYLLDKNDFLKKDTNLNFVLGDNYLDNLNIYDLIIKSPGVKFKDLDIASFEYKITSQLGLVLDLYKNNVIGITGTKGKSTTTSLIFKILSDQNYDAHLVGNIGTPIFDEIDNINCNSIYVIEMAALQLEFVKNSPHIGIILNLFEEHLDFFKNKNDYFLSKMNMFKYMNNTDYGLYTSSNETLKEYVNKNNYKCNLIDINKEMSIRDNYVYINDKIIYNTEDERNLIGSHNLIDIQFALYVSKIFNLELSKTINSINNFKPLEHRLELVGTYNNITYYNDSIATIPSATINAIEALKNVNTLIFGGMDRGIDYSDFIKYLKNSNIENFICMPTTGYKIGKFLESINKNIYYIESLEDAVEKAKEVTKKDTICLMSPAASSYEYFKNFEEKGRMYKEYVKNNNIG